MNVMESCKTAATAVHSAGGLVKALGHALANNVELIRVGEAIPVIAPAFTLLASVALIIHRYRAEKGAVADVLGAAERLSNLAVKALGTCVRADPQGSASKTVEGVLMAVELAMVDVQRYLHPGSKLRKYLPSRAKGPSQVAARLQTMWEELAAIVDVETHAAVEDARAVGLDNNAMLSEMVTGVPRPDRWAPARPYLSTTVNTDAKLYKNEEAVSALAEYFGDDHGFSVAVLSGEGGVGKSEAALCYIREQESLYKGGVVVLNAENSSVAKTSFLFMSGLPKSVDDCVTLKQYMDVNSRDHGRMLLVLDNADALGGASHWLSRWLPHTVDRVDVLLTTRLSRQHKGLRAFLRALPTKRPAKVVDVPLLPHAAATTALRRFIGDDHFHNLAADDLERERVAIEYLTGPRGLGGLLLALVLAGRSIATWPGMTAVKYLERFQEDPEHTPLGLLEEEADVSVLSEEPRSSIRASVRLSLASLQQQSPGALLVLQILSIFPPDGIPLNGVDVAVEVLSELSRAELQRLCAAFPSDAPVLASCCDNLSPLGTLQMLKGMSLLREGVDGVDGVLTMHRLTRAVVHRTTLIDCAHDALWARWYVVACSVVRKGAVREATGLLGGGDGNNRAGRQSRCHPAEVCWGLVACQLPPLASLLRPADLMGKNMAAAEDAHAAATLAARDAYRVGVERQDVGACCVFFTFCLPRPGREPTPEEDVDATRKKIANLGPDASNMLVSVMTKLSENGDSAATFELGTWLENGIIVRRDVDKAASHYQRAAQANHVHAALYLGRCLENGVGVPVDKEAAVRRFRVAATEGCMSAMFELARCLEAGIGVTADVDQAAQLYQAAAMRGHPCSVAKWALCLEQGIGVAVDLQEAARLKREAASMGH